MGLSRGKRRTKKACLRNTKEANAHVDSVVNANGKGNKATKRCGSKLKKEVLQTPCVMRTSNATLNGPVSQTTSPLFNFVSPQKINSGKHGVRSTPLLDSGCKVMISTQCLAEYVGGEITIESLEGKLQEGFTVLNWVSTRRKINTPARYKHDESPKPTNSKSQLQFQHRDCIPENKYRRVMSAFFAGMNQHQYAYDCHVMGEEPFSHVVFNDLVGKRLYRFMIALWRVTQRLVVLRSANMYIDSGQWSGNGPLKLTAAYDTRWQKARGWNSLHGTSYAIDYMTGMPIFVCCMHRSRPTECAPEDGVAQGRSNASTEHDEQVSVNVARSW